MQYKWVIERREVERPKNIQIVSQGALRCITYREKLPSIFKIIEY